MFSVLAEANSAHIGVKGGAICELDDEGGVVFSFSLAALELTMDLRTEVEDLFLRCCDRTASIATRLKAQERGRPQIDCSL